MGRNAMIQFALQERYGIVTAEKRLGQIMAANKACRKPGCACCAHWSATAYLLQLSWILFFQISVFWSNPVLAVILHFQILKAWKKLYRCHA